MEKQKFDKRKLNECDDNGPVSRQPKQNFCKPAATSQHRIDKLIIDYMVAKMKPLRTAETKSFKNLVIQEPYHRYGSLC